MPPTSTPAELVQNRTVFKPNPRNNQTMFQIFHNVQYNVVQHKKYAKEMTKLFKKLNEDEFRESFRNALMYLFTFGDTSANVDRVIQFVATFCTSLDDEEEFMKFIFNIIFECQCATGQSVRYRASQLLAAVLSALGDEASLDDDLCDKLLASQQERIQDTRGAVRCRAALALQRLQNPKDPDDEVTKSYKFHMFCDPSSSVRRAVVMSIAKSASNVAYVIERLCDVDEAVRRAAFLYITAMNVTQLKVRQRVHILKVGLTERSTRVRRVVEEILIPGWLSTFKGNIIDLLKAIRLDNAKDAKDSQYVAGKLLESLFKRLPISELLEWLPTDKRHKLIPAENLNKETAWYWRHLAEHLQKIDDDETLESILPDLVVLTGYIRAIVVSPCPDESEDPVGFSTRQHVLQELGHMLSVHDATDPAGRSELHMLINDVLTGDYGPLEPEVIRAFVQALELVIPEAEARLSSICTIVSALREPPEPDVLPNPPPVVDSTEVKIQKARLRVSLNVAIEAEEEAVRDQNYALAAECKAKVEGIQKKLEDLNVQCQPPPPAPLPAIEEKKSDPETLRKCLTILNCALDTPQLKCVTPSLHTLFTELEVELITNPEIVELALETVTLYGMLDKQYVTKNNKAFLFANLVDTSKESLVMTVLRCISDLLCVHGARMFDEPEDFTTSKQSTICADTLDEGTLMDTAISMSVDHGTVIQILLNIMDSNCPSYRHVVVECLCRLIQLGHLESPSILSRLLLLWFNPATEDEDMLRQTIGVFFQTYPTVVDGAQEQIQKATLPTLRALANAPSSSPLDEIDQEAVVKFIVSLTRVNHETCDSQGAMALTLVTELARRPTCAEAGLACRMLALLAPPRDPLLLQRLPHMLRELTQALPDKQSCRNLTRYLGSLEAIERMSLNKMSNTGMTDGTMQNEDTMFHLGRATSSLPQPIARSTHVVINETVREEQEEVEIDESSPSNILLSSTISEEKVPEATSPLSNRQSTGSTTSDSNQEADDEVQSVKTNVMSDEDSSGVSPVKKAKTTKGKKKKLSLTKKDSNGSKKTVEKEKNDNNKESEKGGVKRTRSQRSLVDVDRAQKGKAKGNKKHVAPEPVSVPQDLDTSNVTIRRSRRSQQSISSTESDGSKETPVAKKASQDTVPKDLDTSNVTIRRFRGSHQSTSSTESNGSKGMTAATKTSQGTVPKDLDTSNVTVRRSRRSHQSTGSTESNGSKGMTAATKTSQGIVLKDLDTSNVTIRSSRRSNQSTLAKKTSQEHKLSQRKTRSSVSSIGSAVEDSADETELHTIVYDKEFEQSLLDSSDIDNSKEVSQTNVTIAETPDASDESDSEPEPELKLKGRGKKK